MLQAVCFPGYDWKGRGDWTTLSHLKTLLHSKNVQLLFSSNYCTKISFCTRISFSIFADQPFLGCTKWRCDFLFVLSLFFILPSRSPVRYLNVNIHEQKAKRSWEASDLHLSSLWMSRHPSFLRIATWSMTKHLSSRPGLEPTSLDCRNKTIIIFSDLYWLSHSTLKTFQFVTPPCSSGFCYQSMPSLPCSQLKVSSSSRVSQRINTQFLILLILRCFLCLWNTLSVILDSFVCSILCQPISLEYANGFKSPSSQSPVYKFLRDVTLVSSWMFFILCGNYLKTLRLLKHGTRIIHWLLANEVGDVRNQ